MIRWLLTLLLTVATAAAATTYYAAVPPLGNDANSGFDTNAPKTIEGLKSLSGPGVTIFLMDGVYVGFRGSRFEPNKSGTPAQPAIWRALNPHQAIFRGSSHEGIQPLAGTSNIWFKDLVVEGAAGDGIANAGSDIGVFGCWIRSNLGNGINVGGPSNHRSRVEGNLIEWNGKVGSPYLHGIYIANESNIVRNNVFRYNRAFGIHQYSGYVGELMHGSRYENNLVYGHTTKAGVAFYNAVWGGSGAGTNYLTGNTILDGIVVRFGTACISNNIILPSHDYRTQPIHTDGKDVPAMFADYNLGTYTLLGPHSIVVADPTAIAFVNPGNGLYWLSSGSPARKSAAASICGPIDFFNLAQSTVADIGAFQYSASLAADTRVLDPSGTGFPNYWALNDR